MNHEISGTLFSLGGGYRRQAKRPRLLYGLPEPTQLRWASISDSFSGYQRRFQSNKKEKNCWTLNFSGSTLPVC